MHHRVRTPGHCGYCLECQCPPIKTLSAQTSGAALSKVALLQLAGEVQNRQRSRQLKAGHARNRLKTLPPPGKAPYGYRRGQERYIIDRMAAPVVHRFLWRNFCCTVLCGERCGL